VLAVVRAVPVETREPAPGRGRVAPSGLR